MKNYKNIFTYLMAFSFVLTLSSFTKITDENKLSENEIASLLHMLEEEKLAHDVYNQFYEKWNLPQFLNIKNAEQNHLNRIKALLDKYEVKYTVLEKGKFVNEEIQKLYNQFITQGNHSEVEALKAAMTIEELDIFDLRRLKNETQNQDIIQAYTVLECGSKNHVRALYKALRLKGVQYFVIHIETKDYYEIVKGQQEKCGQLSE